jgi:PAS domain S-box-containing protein
MSNSLQKTLLLVEDEAIIALTEKMELEKYGYAVEIVHDGQKAIDAANANPAIDLILMDIDLGRGIDGTQAAETILKNHDIPVVFVSSHSEREVVEKTEKITSYGYIVKSSSITVFDASIKMAFKLFEEKLVRKQAEDTLKKGQVAYQEQNAILNTLLDNLTMGVFMVEAPSGRPLIANREAKRLLGRGIMPDASRKNLAEVYRAHKPGSTSPYPVEEMPIIRGMNGESSYVDDMIVEHPDGSEILVEVFGSPIRNEHGEVWASLVSFRDITGSNSIQTINEIAERKKIESELLVQRRIYEQILEQSLAGYWDWDIPAGNEYLSPTFKKMFGYEDHEIENKAASWQALIFAEDLPGVHEKFNLHVQSRGKYPFYNEVRYHHKNGSTVWVICTGKVIEWDESGKPERMIGCHIDITERRKAEEALRKNEEMLKFALEGSNLGEWDWNLLTNEIKRNTRWAEMLGYTLDELNGNLQQGLELEHPDDSERKWKAIQDHLDGKTDYYNVEYRMKMRDGSYRWIQDCGKIMERDADGKPVRLCGTHADIDEQKTARDRIDALLAEKELLLKEVHHRIKNNMSTVGSLLSLQANTTTEPAAMAALKDARARIQSMALMYDTLYMAPDYTELAIKNYLSSLVDQIIAHFPNNRMVRVEKDIQDFVLDVKRLQTLGIILNELLTNTMKYAFKGRKQGQISVSVSNRDKHATVSIQDDGNGIPDSVSVGNSSGFGLQLVHALTQQLDGTITVERNAGTKIVLEFAI